MEDEMLTIEELAAYLKLKPQTIYKWAQSGKIPGAKFGKEWRFRRSTIERWIDSHIPAFESPGPNAPRGATSTPAHSEKPAPVERSPQGRGTGAQAALGTASDGEGGAQDRAADPAREMVSSGDGPLRGDLEIDAPVSRRAAALSPERMSGSEKVRAPEKVGAGEKVAGTRRTGRADRGARGPDSN